MRLNSSNIRFNNTAVGRQYAIVPTTRHLLTSCKLRRLLGGPDWVYPAARKAKEQGILCYIHK